MLNQPIITFGGCIKALSGGKVAGHLVLFGSAEEKDLAGEWFTSSTDFEQDLPGKVTPRYQHDLDPALRGHKFAKADIELDGDVGIWCQAQLDMADEYEKAIYKMADAGKLGWSSGTAAHLVDADNSGEIKRWPLGLDASFTPTPCDPRQRLDGNSIAPIKGGVLALKSLRVLTLDELMGGKSAGVSVSDKAGILQDALDKKVATDYPNRYLYAWIVDIFDEADPKTLVFRCDGSYWEAPYTFDGTRAEIGDAVESIQYTGYKPVGESVPANDFGGMKAAEQGKAVLGATKAYFDRLADIRKVRQEKKQDVSLETLAQLKAVGGELLALHQEISAFMDAGPDDATKAAFEKDAAEVIARAEIFEVERMLAALA